jgi:hypothetical protein
MIEKCARLALQFHGEMEAEDEIDDEKDPPDLPAAASIDPGDTGGNSSGEEGGIGPFGVMLQN